MTEVVSDTNTACGEQSLDRKSKWPTQYCLARDTFLTATNTVNAPATSSSQQHNRTTMHRYPGPRMHVRRQGRRNDNNMSPMIMMLLMQIYQRYEELPVKPPVTFALVAYNVGAHVYPAMVLPYSLDAVCLSSYTFLSAWYRSDWGGVVRRTVLSAFTHADDMHLYYNMGSLLVKGVQLEQKMGSEAFGGFVAFAVVVAHLLSVVVGVFADSMGYQTGCAVGFSGVLFAMKLVLNHGAHAPGSGATSRVWGVKIASRHAHWLEILVASYFNPRSSIVGHACGAALTTPSTLRKATAFDTAIMLLDQSSASTANSTDKRKPNQTVEEHIAQKDQSRPV